MEHSLTAVLNEVQAWAAKSNHAPFKAAAAGWALVLAEQVATDLQTVDCLTNLDEKTDAIKAAKESLCRAMGLEPDMPIVELLRTCEVTFQSLCEITP